MENRKETELNDEKNHLGEGGDMEEQPTLANSLTHTSTEQSECWWESQDTAVRRKLDLNIVPLLCVAYVFAFLDRSNIGNAKVAGMDDTLGIDDPQYQWLLTIFYISYICFQFGVLGYKLFPPSKWMGCAVIAWGTVAILQATAFNWASLMAARFFIGLFEACFGTGVALYLSFFYPRKEVGLRFAWYLVGSAIASALAGSVAYGLQQANVSIDNWRLIFIVEAAPTVLVGVVIFFVLPDSIATARFLSSDERKVAEARLYRAKIDVDLQNAAAAHRANNNGGTSTLSSFLKSKLDLGNFVSALKDPMSYVSACLLFIVNVGYSSIPVYLPTILEGMGYTSLRAQAFSAPPYVVSFVFAIVLVYISDRTDIRGCFVAIVSIIGAVGYLMLAIISDNNARYGAVWLVTISLFSFIPLAYSWLLSNSVGESKKGLALTMFGTVGQLGPILGTRLFPAAEAPYYRRGMYVSAGILLGGTLLSLLTLAYLANLNRRKDKAMQEQQSLHAASSSASSGEEAEKGAERLRFHRKLDLSLEEHRQEQHRRNCDIAAHLDKSIYFRYSL